MSTPILAYTPPYGLPPVALPDPIRIRWEYHPEIVALHTADDEPSLEQLVTANYYALTSRVEINIVVDDAEEAQSWVLLAEAATGSDVSPDDYDAISNNVHWEKVA
jgi:hypothetical protein